VKAVLHLAYTTVLVRNGLLLPSLRPVDAMTRSFISLTVAEPLIGRRRTASRDHCRCGCASRIANVAILDTLNAPQKQTHF